MTTQSAELDSFQRESMRSVEGKSSSSLFAHLAFITCICLQRFGLPLGVDASVSVSLPIMWGLVAWMLVSGKGRIPPGGALLYLLVVIWALMSALGGVLAPDPRGGFSLPSLLEFLSIYLCLIVRPTSGFNSLKVQEIFLFYVRICAVCGIIQYALQFAHIRLFSFGQIIPALKPILLEKDFAWNPLLSYGSSTLRSNGFFLLEPSIFSQLLSAAVVLDIFILNRFRYVPLYLLAYMVSYSGTGILSLAITLAIVGLTSFRNATRVVSVGIAAVMAIALFSVFAPTQVSHFLNRFHELESTQSSGYARYAAQAEELHAFAGETRSLLGYGPGATTRSEYYVPGSGNAALQLFVDYGLVGLSLFFLFFCKAVWRPKFSALSIFFIINFQLGGGYLLFAPYAMLVAVVGIWGTEVSPKVAAASYLRQSGRVALRRPSIPTLAE